MYKLIAFNRNRACVSLMLQYLLGLSDQSVQHVNAAYQRYRPTSSVNATWIFNPEVRSYFSHHRVFNRHVKPDGLADAISEFKKSGLDTEYRQFVLGFYSPSTNWGHAIAVQGTVSEVEISEDAESSVKGCPIMTLSEVLLRYTNQRSVPGASISMAVWRIYQPAVTYAT